MSLRLATLCAVALGAGLRWPALLAGFHSDDYQQLAMLRERFVLARPTWDLFWFGPGSAAELVRLVDFGFDPWWTSAAHRLSMLRPLSSLLIALDATLFGDDAVLFHLHSLAWWVALVLSVALLLSRLLPARVAALAVLLFALDEAHNVPLAWLANRSTLVSATLGVLALVLHLHARAQLQPVPEQPRPRAASLALALSAGLWALSLAGGEYGFGLLAYLLAFELFGAQDRLRVRLAHLAAPLAIAASYLALRAQLGHGASGSGMYISPSEPGRYLVLAGARVAALASELLLGVPASWLSSNTPLRNVLLELQLFDAPTWRTLPDWQTLHTVIGVFALLAGAWLLRWLARHAGADFAALRWLVCGALLALPAAAATAPSARLLIAPAIGASALLALAVVHAAQRARSRLLPALLCGAALIVHGGVAAHNAHAQSAFMRAQSSANLRWARAAELPADARDVDVVVISASDFATAANLPWIRLWLGLPLPRSYRRLSGAMQAHELVRLDAHSLELRVLSNDVRDAFAGSIYRAREDALHPGHRMRMRGMEVEVLGTLAGNPYRLRVRLDRALDDPRVLFLHARDDGLRRFVPPPPGESLVLPRAAFPR